MTRKLREIFLVAFMTVLVCGLVWAVAELSGQSNKSAADAGSSAADMEMATLDPIKPSTEATGDANKETAIRNKIMKADNAYKSKLAQAKSETNSKGKVSPGTRDAGMTAARQYKAANDEYAAYWDSQKCGSRAQLAREVGESRMKSAEMAFNDVSSDKVNAYNKQQDRVRTAQKAYFKDAKKDVSESDRAAIKSGVTPRLKKIGGDLTTLLSTVTGLLNQVQQQVGGSMNFSPSGIGGCAQKMVSEGPSSVTAAAPEGVAELLSPLKSMLSLVQSMSGNVTGMISDINSL